MAALKRTSPHLSGNEEPGYVLSDSSVTPNPPQIASEDDQALRALTSNMAARSKLSINIGQQIIVVNEDKIELCLRKHLDRMGRRQEWLAPAGIAITLLLTLLTTTFHDAFSIPAATWQAFCMIALVLSVLWLIRTLYAMPNATSIADVVRELREESRRNVEP